MVCRVRPSPGVFPWGVGGVRSERHHGDKQGEGTQFVFLSVVWWLYSGSALERRCTMSYTTPSRVFLYDNNTHAHTHTRTGTHPLQAPVSVGECVCV